MGDLPRIRTELETGADARHRAHHDADDVFLRGRGILPYAERQQIHGAHVPLRADLAFRVRLGVERVRRLAAVRAALLQRDLGSDPVPRHLVSERLLLAQPDERDLDAGVGSGDAPRGVFGAHPERVAEDAADLPDLRGEFPRRLELHRVGGGAELRDEPRALAEADAVADLLRGRVRIPVPAGQRDIRVRGSLRGAVDPDPGAVQRQTRPESDVQRVHEVVLLRLLSVAPADPRSAQILPSAPDDLFPLVQIPL